MPTYKSLAAMFATFPQEPVVALERNIAHFLWGSDSSLTGLSSRPGGHKLQGRPNGLVPRTEWIFKHSFDIKRFYSKGERPWKPNNRWGKRGEPHELMYETGTLKSSITSRGLAPRPHQVGASIYTDLAPFKAPNLVHSGTCYADVHNAPSGTYTYGNTGIPSIQRQFMGHSSHIDDYIRQHVSELFKGFPISKTITL